MERDLAAAGRAIDVFLADDNLIVREGVRACLAMVGMLDYLERYPRELSGGRQLQRPSGIDEVGREQVGGGPATGSTAGYFCRAGLT